MIEDVYEPLAAYRDTFKSLFSSRVRKTFQDLTKQSGVDVMGNRKQVAKIECAQQNLQRARRTRLASGILLALLVVAVLALVIVPSLEAVQPVTSGVKFLCVLGAVACVGLAIWMGVMCAQAHHLIHHLEPIVKALIAQAQKQMASLNQLYTWDIPVRLIEQTVPRLQFDPFLTAKRLKDLKRLYGWNESFHEDKSILFAHSGVINGNPFLIGSYREMKWGTKTYYGYKTIYWTEYETDSEGHRQRVERSEQLVASVTKPIPTYPEHKILIYGNDAAPELSFSRQPSGLSPEDDLFNSIKKGWRLRGLKSKARNLDDDSNFTLMANHEFETWFHAEDRSDEVAFRLLFTPLAQTQMLALMKDRTSGYGDDFYFFKQKKLNYIYATHLDKLELDTSPEHFKDWNYDRAWHNFCAWNENYFRALYFALAPVLAIPLYQQTRTHEEIWKDVLDDEGAASWEHEALANFYGDARFKALNCITQNILKTRVVKRAEHVSEVEVTASGYKGVERVDYESVLGGDERWHRVEVPWTEYLPVSNTSTMVLSEDEKPPENFVQRFQESPLACSRRHIHSFI